jgi:glycyl-tRNA synthetase beta chain
MPELLLELLSEEIPARMQVQAADDLATLVGTLLRESGLTFDEPIARWSTPRRLAIVVRGVPAKQADRQVERRGPRKDAPAQALDGFLRSLRGLEHRLVERDDPKGKVLFALVEEPGRATAEILGEALPGLLARFPWPKSMRWGDGEARWVRPLRSILCLFDGEVVPFEFGGVRSGNTTEGHRFIQPARFEVPSATEYLVDVAQGSVQLDPSERKEQIRLPATRLASAFGLRLRRDEDLLDELAGLVEWPKPLLGRIDPGFMDLPPEVLVTTMRTHQRYLALEHGDGRLADRFVVVANIAADDGGAAIVQGNERVLRARLWDARFFWEQDRRRPLEDGLAKLESVVFHAELGTQGERVRRLVALAGQLAAHVPGAHRALAERAAVLAKADLVTGLVGEFPELQGIVGGHIALAQGEPEAVARAIAEHYAPKGPDDICPREPVSVAVALADRLDTLTGFLGAGIRPTGSKDPFALRRAALGVIRLILENGLRLPLRAVTGAVAADLLAFLADRLKVHLRGEGVRHDLIAAVFAAGADDDLVRLIARVRALQAFMATDDGRNLLAGYRRAANIVAIERKKEGREHIEPPYPHLVREPAERDLVEALGRAQALIAPAIEGEDFAGAMREVARLRVPIDAFFEAVMVNAPEPELRANRLCMLNSIRRALGGIADFSLIEDAPA